MSKSKRRPGAGTRALLLLGAAAPALAAEPAVLDSVVIQNERQDRTRAVEVQTTPAAITSLSGAKLEEQGIGNVRDLGNIVPNLFQPRTAVSYLNSAFYIRGIGEPDAQGEPSVAVYFDDLYWSKNLGANIELLDVERVEVFRGPQGQQFGHSALAGVLRVNSTVPTETTRLRALVEGGNYNDRKLGVAVSGGLSEMVLGSLVRRCTSATASRPMSRSAATPTTSTTPQHAASCVSSSAGISTPPSASPAWKTAARRAACRTWPTATKTRTTRSSRCSATTRRWCPTPPRSPSTATCAPRR
jgi:outer membrane receptor protein involved in Fe transport